MATSASAGEVPFCVQERPQILSLDTGVSSDTNGCFAPAQPANAGSYELKAEASDGGAYWFEADDPGARRRISLTTDAELNRAITFRAQHLTGAFGEFESHGGVGRIETSDAVTFERLQWADGYREDSTAVGVGATEKLFDGRLTVGTDLSWSTSTSRWADGGGPGVAEILSRAGAARWHKLEAKIFDGPDFKWSIAGEVSTVDKDYRGNAAARPLGLLSLSGERNDWRSALSAFGADAVVSIQHFAGQFFGRDAKQAQIDFKGISATIYDKDLQRRSFLDATQWTSRKQIDGATLELTPTQLAPGLASSTALIPQLVSATFETGHVDYPTGPDAREGVSTFEALAQWKTMLGDTTATYTRERQGRNAPGVGFSGELDQLMDVSHAIKFGDWRFSAGADLVLLGNTSVEDQFADSAVSGTFSIRYAPTRGPKFSASLGRSQDEFAFDALSLSSRSKATTLAVSLDLTDFVQDRLNRRDTHLTLQYRHQLHESAVSYDALTPEEATRNTDALLVSFRTPLN